MNTRTLAGMTTLLLAIGASVPCAFPAERDGPASVEFPWFRLAPVGTWYITFLIDGAPPGFNVPGVITFHHDGTFTAVDGGDFGALPDLPFDQTSQQGVWRRSEGRKFVATGMILSFRRTPGMEGEIDNVSRTRIELEFGQDLDQFTAVVSQEVWNCPSSFTCPDPLTAPPDMVLPAEGFSILARRVKAQ